MKLVIIKRFRNYIEANIVKGMLEANEISCWLQDEYLGFLGKGSGIKLMVREDQEQAALDLIQTTRDAD